MVEKTIARAETYPFVTPRSPSNAFSDFSKIAEHQLHEKTSLSRNLWAALVGAVLLVDDWCAGPLLAWRYNDGKILVWG